MAKFLIGLFVLFSLSTYASNSEFETSLASFEKVEFVKKEIAKFEKRKAKEVSNPDLLLNAKIVTRIKDFSTMRDYRAKAFLYLGLLLAALGIRVSRYQKVRPSTIQIYNEISSYHTDYAFKQFLNRDSIVPINEGKINKQIEEDLVVNFESFIQETKSPERTNQNEL